MNDDTISRAAAIDALDEQIKFCDNALCDFNISLKDEYAVKVERASLCAYKEILEDLPSAQPKQTDCEYCHEDFDGYVRPIEKNSPAWLIRQGRTMKLRVCFKGGKSECDILFCPMCGRRLTDG